VIAEDRFSHATYDQDRVQNRNGDATVFDFIITKEYEVVDKDVVAPMPDTPKVYLGRAALEHALRPCKRRSIQGATMCFDIERNDSSPIWAPMNQAPLKVPQVPGPRVQKGVGAQAPAHLVIWHVSHEFVYSSGISY
jgi:hypothetical protein